MWGTVQIMYLLINIIDIRAGHLVASLNAFAIQKKKKKRLITECMDIEQLLPQVKKKKKKRE